MLTSAWSSVTVETIVNCFRKAKISEESQSEALSDEDNPFKELQDEMDSLRAVKPNLMPENITDTDLVDVDTDLQMLKF